MALPAERGKRSGARDGVERRPFEAVRLPLVEWGGTEPGVEVDGELVPAKHVPFHPRAAPAVRLRRHRTEEPQPVATKRSWPSLSAAGSGIPAIVIRSSFVAS